MLLVMMALMMGLNALMILVERHVQKMAGRNHSRRTKLLIARTAPQMSFNTHWTAIVDDGASLSYVPPRRLSCLLRLQAKIEQVVFGFNHRRMDPGATRC